MNIQDSVSVPIRGLFNLTGYWCDYDITQDASYEFPSPSGDYLI